MKGTTSKFGSGLFPFLGERKNGKKDRENLPTSDHALINGIFAMGRAHKKAALALLCAPSREIARRIDGGWKLTAS